jgi:hypothetical protein
MSIAIISRYVEHTFFTKGHRTKDDVNFGRWSHCNIKVEFLLNEEDLNEAANCRNFVRFPAHGPPILYTVSHGCLGKSSLQHRYALGSIASLRPIGGFCGLNLS